VASQYTSFVVVERRTGDRRAEGGAPETRVVPVNAPAGWAIAGTAPSDIDLDDADDFMTVQSIPVRRSGVASPAKKSAPRPPMAPAPAMPMAPSAAPLARPAAQAGPAPAPSRARMASDESEESSALLFESRELMKLEDAEDMPAAPSLEQPEHKPGVFAKVASMLGISSPKAPVPASPASPAPRMESKRDAAKEKSVANPIVQDPSSTMSQQLASGLWSESDDRSAVRDTARALWSLFTQGVTTAHPMYGTPVKKAIEALLDRVKKLAATDESLAAFALGVAWLVATGRRTRGDVEALAAANPQCAGKLSDERAARAWVESLAASV
jgi:Ca-activated chloride channel family protein